MKANELRIGNLITRKNKVLKVWIIHPDKILVSGYSWGKYFKCEYLEPIPLTEEWLFKFGFYKVGENSYNHNNFWFCELSKNNELRFDDLGNVYVKYVHSLQNLYFALTGEELVEQP